VVEISRSTLRSQKESLPPNGPTASSSRGGVLGLDPKLSVEKRDSARMRTYRRSCWLLLWDHQRTFGRDDCDHLQLPRFVGTLPNRMSRRSVSMMLPTVLLSHAPVSLSTKVNCGKSVSRGQPRLDYCSDFPSDTVTCTLGRLILVARQVRDLRVAGGENGCEIMTWIEARRYWPDPQDLTSDGQEILPERIMTMVQTTTCKPIA